MDFWILTLLEWIVYKSSIFVGQFVYISAIFQDVCALIAKLCVYNSEENDGWNKYRNYLKFPKNIILKLKKRCPGVKNGLLSEIWSDLAVCREIGCSG